MPEEPLPAECRVARLVANRPKPGGCWRELYVLRDLGVVHVFDVYSHNRRWVRGLVYTTDTRYTLEERQPTLPQALTLFWSANRVAQGLNMSCLWCPSTSYLPLGVNSHATRGPITLKGK